MSSSHVKPGLPDVKDAVKTVAQVDDAQDLARTAHRACIALDACIPRFKSRSARHIRESVEGMDLPVFQSSLMERAGFRDSTCEAGARQVSPTNSLTVNVRSITQELLANLERMTEAA